MGLKEPGLRGSLRNVSVRIGAIPDSEADQKLAHRWLLGDDDGALDVSDSEGGADGTNNGVSPVEGDYADGVAGEGDGSSYIETSSLGSFGGDMTNDFAIALTIETTDNGCYFLGHENDDRTRLTVGIGEFVSDDRLEFYIQDSDTNSERVESDSQFNDGSKHRVVFNKTGNSASDFEIWVDQSEVGVSVDVSQGFNNPSDFDDAVALFAVNIQGSISNNHNGIQDDICIFGDSLTSTEIQSYDNPW